MSSLTGELRSATVTAATDVEVLVVRDADFHCLRERRPLIAVAMVRVLAQRLRAVEQSVDALLSFTGDRARPAQMAAGAGAAGGSQRGSLGRVWSEMVVSRRRDLAFLTLAAFVLTLVLVRAGGCTSPFASRSRPARWCASRT